MMKTNKRFIYVWLLGFAAQACFVLVLCFIGAVFEISKISIPSINDNPMMTAARLFFSLVFVFAIVPLSTGIVIQQLLQLNTTPKEDHAKTKEGYFAELFGW